MNILTFDIEDWFHLLDVKNLDDPSTWSELESRVEQNTLYILDALAKYNHKATFFVLGWIAEKFPALIMEICRRGHEIGSHSFYHPLLYKLNFQDFETDLRKSIDVLGNVTGRDVSLYRAPGFSLCSSNYSYLRVMRNAGITIDASIFPAKRAHGGIPESSIEGPTILHVGREASIVEMPMTPVKICGKKFTMTGGGYFRITPLSLLEMVAARKEYTMWYFHPRDFDPFQPKISDLSRVKFFKSYVGLQGSKNKFDTLLRKYRFISIGCYLKDHQITANASLMDDRLIAQD